jgi:hypothetical protein
MSKLIIIPIKKTKSGYKVLRVILSNNDYTVAVNNEVDWLQKSIVTDSKDHPNFKLVWDQKRCLFKLQLIMKELLDVSRCETESDNSSSDRVEPQVREEHCDKVKRQADDKRRSHTN